MKSKSKNIIEKIKNENGLVIVESAIVFPVMFFVLFFILFVGNVYYEQAKVDNIVLKYALNGAQYISDLSMQEFENGGNVPTAVNGMDIAPYRYILGPFGGGAIDDIESNLSNQVKNEINNGAALFFANSKANVVSSDNANIAQFKSYVVYSTFIVQVNYEIRFPIRLWGQDSPMIAKLSSRAEVSVNDAPEFIRNVDMVVDFFDGTTTGEKVSDTFERINSFIDKFS